MSSCVESKEVILDCIQDGAEEESVKTPNIFSTVLFGLQALFAHVFALIYEPLVLLSGICLLPDDPIRGKIISLTLLISAASTILQCIFIKLPAFSSPSRLHLAAVLLVLDHDAWRCPTDGDLYSMGSAPREEQFQARMSELRGYFLVVTLVQTLIFLSGVPDVVAGLVSRATVSTALISSSLANLKASVGRANPGLSILTLSFFLLHLLFRAIKTPRTGSRQTCSMRLFTLFKSLPIFIVVFCYLIYTFGVGETVESNNYLRRSIETIQWSPFSLLGVLGLPTFSLRTTLFAVGGALAQNLMTFVYFSIFAHFTGETMEATKVTRGTGVELVGGAFGSIFGVPIPAITNTNMIAIGQITNVKRSGGRVGLAAGSALLLGALSAEPLASVARLAPAESLLAFNALLQGAALAVGLSVVAESQERERLVASASLVIGLIVPELLFLDTKSSPLNLETSILLSTMSSLTFDLVLRKI